MTDLASLVVKLSAETSEYTAAIQKATDQIGSFSDSVGSSIADVAKNLLGLEALKQIFDFSDNIVKTMASFEELSHAVGATSETLSQLSFAGKLTGVDDIGAALEKMARSVGLAETGNQKLIGTFSALGVSLTDASGKVKSTDQQLLGIADAVSKYNDGLAKTSAVQAIFGRGGADFIAFLDQGAEKIKEAQQEAIDLGVSISSPAAKAAEEFESNMTRIGAAFEGVFYKALQEVLPIFQSITDQVIAFAKNADNMQPIIEQVAAGFKLIGTVIVIVGTAFEVVGKSIGAVTAEIGFQISALADLAKAFTDPLGSMKSFVADQASGLDSLANTFLHPIDSAKAFVNQQKQNLDDLTNTFLHPIDAAKAFVTSQTQAFKDSPLGDIVGTIKSGASSVADIWGDADAQLNAISVTAKKIKPDLVLIDQTQLKAIEAGIEALAKLDDTLKQQVATYGLSGAAATVYDVTLGKLSASVAEIDKMSPKQAQQALAQLEKQGKLSQAAIDEINASIKAGVPIGDAFKASIINSANALDQLKAVDALSKLDAQLLTMTGHLQAAGQAAFDLANRPLRVTIQTQQDNTQFSGLGDSAKTAEATSQVNSLKQQAITIEDALGKKVADVDAAGLASSQSNLQIAGEEAVARQDAIAQLETLYVKAQALANATGMKSAVDEANALRAAIGAIQFNPKIITDVNAATEAQKKFLEVTVSEKKANDDLSLAMADLAKQNAQGSLTDLDYMGKQDVERQKAIDQLTIVQGQYLDLYNNNPGNAAALDQYKKLGVQIDGIEASMGQLAKTVRTDLTDDLSNAFVGFATGAESAKKAAQQFLGDFSKQMLDLAAKQLFQKLFETTGISSAIDSLFGGATKAASGLAGSTAAATTIGTGITTAGTAAATEMGTAITTAGSAAAAEMAAAIAGGAAAGGAAGGASAATVVALAAAGGGPIPANQLTLVGEEGPELFVSDTGSQTAAVATQSGAVVPDDLTHAHVVGSNGPEYIRPGVSGFVIPSDTFLAAMSAHTPPEAPPLVVAPPDVGSEPVKADSQGLSAAQSQNVAQPLAPVVDLVPLITARLPLPETPQPIPAPTPQQSGLASAANASSYSMDVNGIETPIGLTETFTTDSQGRTSINENVNAYVGLQLPAGTATASGGSVVTASDLAYPPAGESPDQFLGIQDTSDQLSQQGTTLASYFAQFDGKTSGGPSLPNDIAAPSTLDKPTSAMIMKFENVIKHQQPPMLDSTEYEALLTDRYLQKRQGGGPVSAGKPYLVGEGGPELMVPDSSGTVMSSWQTTQNNQPIINLNNNFVINTPTGKIDRASQGQIAARTALSVQMASARNN